jgi:hypothetical protein
VAPNNLLLRTRFDKVHAPNYWDGIQGGARALQVWRVAAEQGR